MSTNYDNDNPDEIHESPWQRDEGASKRRRLIIIAALLAIIALVQGIKIYVDSRSAKRNQETLEATQVELDSARAELESIRGKLAESIAETERLGGDIAELTEAKARVEEDLSNMGNNLARIRQKVKGYERLLRAKDAELRKLKALNKELYSENKGLKAVRGELSDSIAELARNTTQLESKVAIASRLRAEGISVMALNKRGKGRPSPFKSRQISSLKVTFNIAENKVAPVEGKKILIRITDPKNRVIFDVKNGSGTFTKDGKEEFYTAAKDILFEKNQQSMSFVYKKDTPYEPGNYRIEALTEDYTMGKSTFTVK